MKPVISPPYAVQRGAWDCAWVLKQDHAERLPIAKRVAVEVVVRMAPERLGWAECGQMLALYRVVVPVRV